MTVLNSAFFTAFFGAIAGALSAAWLAWWGARRSRLRDEILACNVSIALATTTLNGFLSMKRQSLQPLLDRYAIERGRLFLVTVIQAFGGGGVFVLRYELHQTMKVWVPIDALNSIISNRIVSGGRPATVAASLTQAIRNHELYTDIRNDLARNMRGVPDTIKQPVYFGYPTASGYDSSYVDAMNGLENYTEDCLYFGELLIEILGNHGRMLAGQYGSGAPLISRPDLENSRYRGLMPKRELYPDFEKAFRSPAADMIVSM